jgi:hypothetical protein
MCILKFQFLLAENSTELQCIVRGCECSSVSVDDDDDDDDDDDVCVCV